MKDFFLRGLRRAAKSFGYRRGNAIGFEFTVEVEKDDLDGGFVARCLEFSGCVSEGETEQEAVANIVDAIGGVIMARLRANLTASAIEPGPAAAAPSANARRLKIAVGA